MKTIKKAIVSVFDKSGVIEFVKTLINEYGVEILSTGGGPTMIRAAAKNFPDVIVIPDSKYYKGIIKELKANNGAISDKTRANLAQQVFTIMADYNATIVNYLKNYYYPDEKMGTQLVKIFEKLQDCRYGENWDQAAAYYRDVNAKHGLHDLKKLGG
ncbi:MAG: hypothetical protein ACTSR5_18210, partial [Promethearchaeota archaeon]